MRAVPARPGLRPALAALGLTASVVFVACGSGEVTQDDYRAATGEVCARYQKVVDADQAKVNRLGAKSSQDPKPFAAAVRQFQRNWDEFAAALKAVERPPDDRRQLNRFFASLSASQDRVADLARAVDQLPGLLDEVEAIEQSRNAAQAESVIARAEKLQAEIERAESGFEKSIGEVERFVNRYPGLADCR